MTTYDYRALCAELTAWAEKTSAHYFQPPDVLLRARAALANEPAVPQGREPTSVTGEPSDEELLELWHGSDWYNEGATLREFCSIARAVLARWGNPAPQQPADGEVAELVADLQECADSCILSSKPYWAEPMRRAAELLQRQVLVPVPVSERLPGPEDCDSHGWCWVLYSAHSTWTLEPPYGQDGMPTGWTHWLPAHALPLPEVGE